VLQNVLLQAFLALLIFFGFNQSQFLLLDPFRVDFSFHRGLSLNSLGLNINALALIVLGQSWFFWFLRLSLFNWGLFSNLSFGFFLDLLVFVLVQFIFYVSNISETSTLLPWSVFSSCSASSIMSMASGNAFDGSSALSFMFVFVTAFLHVSWNLGINGLCRCSSSALLFELSSLFVGLYNISKYFF
jgi:hypothetical protein